MAKFKIIDIDVYKRNITVFIGSHEEFKEWCSQYDGLPYWKNVIKNIIDSDDDAVASYWYNCEDGNGIIELSSHPKSKEEIAVAAHECLHCVFHCLSYVGIPFIPNEANESFTYLLEYILEQVLDYDNYELINI